MMLIGLRSLILAGLLAFSAPALAQRPEPGEVIDQVARYTGFTNDTVSLALKDNEAALDRLTVDRIQAEAKAKRRGPLRPCWIAPLQFDHGRAGARLNAA